MLDKYFQEETQRTVIKRNGHKEPFSEEKIKRWSKYAAKHDVNWKELYGKTLDRLPLEVTTEEIHSTMIKVCLDKEELKWSRVAARLEYATLRKNMAQVGISDKDSFLTIYHNMCELGLWDAKSFPEPDPIWDEWYKDLYPNYFEFWQIKQWNDKYAVKIDDKAVETPHMGALAMALAIHGTTQEAYDTAKAVVYGQLNLPTPVLNGCRNGDFDSISCCVITGGDSVDSIGVAEHIAYKMTAKKAGIGIEMATRSLGEPVKGGRIKHLGKVPIFATVDKAVKMFTQVSRGGSATVAIDVYDLEVVDLLLLKSQRTPENRRLDKLDYSLVYDDEFLDAVINNKDITLRGKVSNITKTINARKLLATFLTVRQETGRVYCFNKSEANRHTPFIDEIRLSNLCQEICLPTKPYVDMNDLYGVGQSNGETAFCSLSAINVSRVYTHEEYERLAYLAVKTVDNLIERAPMMTNSMKMHITKRRSIGIGITGLAGWLHREGRTYSDANAIERLAEMHYYYLLKASQKLVEEGRTPCEGIKEDWLPIDTKRTKTEPFMNWEELRGKPRRNSVLVAHMPTESSAVFSDATNGLYPVRTRVINKQSRYGNIQYIAPNVVETAWDIDNLTLARAYAAVQAYTDQAISADYYITPSRFEGGKVPMSKLIKDWVAQARLGNKTMYYSNTNDYNGGTFSSSEEEGCEGGCKL
ncbi:ribonucleoside-diphosphate reductase 1 subunit alpha [Vibrio phage vB_ValC_WD615]|nr:ribonucleoside-diphosphate reductase 1 subunit alpha [Vibrio phage vB_ValC_WD615]